jgi:hypothetical protein
MACCGNKNNKKGNVSSIENIDLQMLRLSFEEKQYYKNMYTLYLIYIVSTNMQSMIL